MSGFKQYKIQQEPYCLSVNSVVLYYAAFENQFYNEFRVDFGSQIKYMISESLASQVVIC